MASASQLVVSSAAKTVGFANLAANKLDSGLANKLMDAASNTLELSISPVSSACLNHTSHSAAAGRAERVSRLLDSAATTWAIVESVTDQLDLTLGNLLLGSSSDTLSATRSQLFQFWEEVKAMKNKEDSTTKLPLEDHMSSNPNKDMCKAESNTLLKGDEEQSHNEMKTMEDPVTTPASRDNENPSTDEVKMIVILAAVPVSTDHDSTSTKKVKTKEDLGTASPLEDDTNLIHGVAETQEDLESTLPSKYAMNLSHGTVDDSVAMWASKEEHISSPKEAKTKKSSSPSNDNPSLSPFQAKWRKKRHLDEYESLGLNIERSMLEPALKRGNAAGTTVHTTNSSLSTLPSLAFGGAPTEPPSCTAGAFVFDSNTATAPTGMPMISLVNLPPKFHFDSPLAESNAFSFGNVAVALSAGLFVFSSKSTPSRARKAVRKRRKRKLSLSGSM